MTEHPAAEHPQTVEGRPPVLVGAPTDTRGVNQAIVYRFTVPREQIAEMLNDEAFVTKARLLLHEQMGGCYSADPTRCFDTRHRVRIDTRRFLERLFSEEPYSPETCPQCDRAIPDHRFDCPEATR